MRRDMDVVRDILLAVRDATGPVSLIPEMPKETFAAHAQLLEEAGFVMAALRPEGKRLASDAVIFRLTWSGHDFLDAVRDPAIWTQTKNGAEAAGGFTVDLLKDLAKGFIKKQIEEYTGVKL